MARLVKSVSYIVKPRFFSNFDLNLIYQQRRREHKENYLKVKPEKLCALCTLQYLLTSSAVFVYRNTITIHIETHNHDQQSVFKELYRIQRSGS